VITIKVDDKGCVGEQGRDTKHNIHGISLLLMVIARMLLTRQVDKHGKAHVNVAKVKGIVNACRQSKLWLVVWMI
jgi:hypothetical protein